MSANAAILLRGVHNANPTFDPNSNGGVWKNLVTDYGATCNGTGTNDATALSSWYTYSQGLYPAFANLRIPIGSRCVVSGAGLTFPAGGDPSTVPPTNAIIWAYGATIDFTSIGGADFYFNAVGTSSARIQSVSAGASSVTLITAANSAIFSVGDWICVDGLETINGFPPAWQFYEYRVITSITGTTTKVIGLSSPLANSYKSTWPLPFGSGADGLSVDLAGPASIHKMVPSWNSNITVYGLTILNPGAQQTNIVGRTIVLQDVSIVNGSGGPSAIQSGWFFNSTFNGVEVDKEIELLSLYRAATVTGGNISVQSPSPTQLQITSSTFINAVGTAINTVITNSVVPQILLGPTQAGVGNAIAVDISTITTVFAKYGSTVIASTLTYDGAGTFSISKSAGASYNAAVSWGIPGAKVAFGNSNNINSSPLTTFTITDASDDASNLFIHIDIPGALPTPTCDGIACSNYNTYGAHTITQKFTGPANLPPLAAPP